MLENALGYERKADLRPAEDFDSDLESDVLNELATPLLIQSQTFLVGCSQ